MTMPTQMEGEDFRAFAERLRVLGTAWERAGDAAQGAERSMALWADAFARAEAAEDARWARQFLLGFTLGTLVVGLALVLPWLLS